MLKSSLNFSSFYVGPHWIALEFIPVFWSFEVNFLTASMGFLVSSITTCVLLYSCSYMASDPYFPKFLSYLHLFSFFMFLMVFSGNLVQFFFGWEGIGLVSFFLIGFWNHRPQALKSALKASIYNRIGDFFLLLLTVSVAWGLGTTSFSTLLLSSNCIGLPAHFVLFYYISGSDLLCVFLLLAAFAKSAQFGFHGWLPDAMEGPTPVSALLHAATMVTAGVFLVLRCHNLVESSALAQLLLTTFGLLTAALGTFSGFYQKDIKRVVAYSTTANLGFMIASCGLGLYGVALFHLLSHGFFKAYLFLSSGLVIHSFGGEQDLRGLRGKLLKFPALFPISLIGSLLSLGFPFLCSFYSKDLILFTAHGTISIPSQLFFFLFSFLVFFGVFYSVRSNGFLVGTPLVPGFAGGLPSFLQYFPVILLGIFSAFFGRSAFELFSSSYAPLDQLVFVHTPVLGLWQEFLCFFPFEDGLHSLTPVFSLALGLIILRFFRVSSFAGLARFGSVLHFVSFFNRFHLNAYLSKFLTRTSLWFSMRYFLLLFESAALEYAMVHLLSQNFYSIQCYYGRHYSAHTATLFGSHYPLLFMLLFLYPFLFSFYNFSWLFLSFFILLLVLPD